ncbi:MAG TPA: family 1 glycosylhydrolase [Thermoanaerobaculia bacterium]
MPGRSAAKATFLWGVATSSYQIEGAVSNDWTEWEALGKLKNPRARCGEASFHRARWRDDYDLLPAIGANAYRFSIEWSRVEPRRGEYDLSSIELERARAAKLRRLGIEPVVTLHHYTHPRWFWERGGWEDPGSIEDFRRLAATVGRSLSPDVRTWVTLNEPIVLVLGGYMAGWIPPGKTSFASASRALENLLRAHAAAAAELAEIDSSARCGIAHNMLDFAPDRESSFADRKLAAAAEALYNRAVLEALATGSVRWIFPGQGRAAFEVPELAGSSAFVGVNYYSRVHMRFQGLGPPAGGFFYRDPEHRGLTEMGWEIHPRGMARLIREAASVGVPVLVTENGIATRDDAVRREFLREHAVVLAHLESSGVPLAGYFHWSLLDNFEWLEGFRPRFGLYEVDYSTGARRRRPSADLFASLGRSFVKRDLVRNAPSG